MKLDPIDYDNLDIGIRRWVNLLRDGGMETFESCQGGEGHAFLEPTIRFHGEYGDGFRAYAITRTHALPVAELRRVWREEDCELKGPHWEIVFSRADSITQRDIERGREIGEKVEAG